MCSQLSIMQKVLCYNASKWELRLHKGAKLTIGTKTPTVNKIPKRNLYLPKKLKLLIKTQTKKKKNVCQRAVS